MSERAPPPRERGGRFMNAPLRLQAETYDSFSRRLLHLGADLHGRQSMHQSRGGQAFVRSGA